MIKAHLLIDGNEVDAKSGRTFERCNPITDESASMAPAASPVDVGLAADAASRAFADWAATPPGLRRELLMKAAGRLLESGQEIVQAMVLETGAAESWAAFNLKLGCELLQEAAAMTTQLTGDVIPTEKPGCLSYSSREPRGVCLGMAPWNAPIVLFVRSFAMPIACGNTVVLKSSELCPATHFLIAKVVSEGILPAGVLNLISHAAEDAPDVVSSLIEHPAVRHINFTGSSHVGGIIAQQAGALLKPTLLELGGKSPILVLDDADLSEAVDAAAFGSFMHQGQICMATGRIVVLESIADSFVDLLARKAESIGAVGANGSARGSMISSAAALRIDGLIEDAVSKGATRRSGGPSNGPFADATVLDHVTPEMKIYYAEAFGPIAPVIRVTDDEAAVRVANDTEYGLSAAVFSQNIRRAMTVSRLIQSGICHINGPTVQDEAQIPFGGVKSSGYGRFGGRGGVEAFTFSRWVTIETQKPHYPF